MCGVYDAELCTLTLCILPVTTGVCPAVQDPAAQRPGEWETGRIEVLRKHEYEQ